LPEWLRFLKGVVDSEDLPLNISRETMQDRSLIEKLNKVITKRFLKFLADESTARPDAYNEFYAEFGVFLKEGAALDFTHKDQLTKLLASNLRSPKRARPPRSPTMSAAWARSRRKFFISSAPPRRSRKRPVSRRFQGPQS